MPGNPHRLVVARLTIASSYRHNAERPATDGCDTVQFFLSGTDDRAFRIRTFALDHDIHVHQLSQPAADAVIHAHLDRTYGDVLGPVHVVALPHLSTVDIRTGGIASGELEVVPVPGYAFWNPDGGAYRTRSEPINPAERQGLKEVAYLGGIARFWVPGSWRSEMDPESGGQFYDPDRDSVLRLNVISFDTTAATEPPRVRHTPRPGERAIDGGRLLAGYEFDVYEVDDHAEGTRLRFWQIAQVLRGQCRIYIFSYAYPLEDNDGYADELAVLDREVRRMVPYPEPV